MVTENGDFPYLPMSPEYELPSPRRVVHPPRLDPLRIHPPTARSPIAVSPRSAGFRQPLAPRERRLPPADYHHLPPPNSSRAFPDDESTGNRAPGRSHISPTFVTPSYEHLLVPHSGENTLDRPVRKLPPPRPLRTSASSPRLYNSRHPQGYYLRERRMVDPSLTLLLPHSATSGPPDNIYGDDTPHSSDISALTSRSSFEHASGTERSSVITKGSSITDFSPDTPDGPYDVDEGMSVEDAISMYLDGFSDVTEEPASPELHAENKLRPASAPPSPDLPAKSVSASDNHSQDLGPPLDLSPVPPAPGPLLKDQNSSEDYPNINRHETKVILPGPVPPPLLSETDSRDRYGFRKSTAHISVKQYNAWSTSYFRNFVAARKTKWTGLLKDSGLQVTEPTVFPPKSPKVKRFIRKGIPPEYRGAAWFWYAGGFDLLKKNPSRYGRLTQQAMASPTNDDKEHIERDLHRTFPDNVHFKPEFPDQHRNQDASSGSSNLKYSPIIYETEMIQSLRRVLYAFSLHNPKVGYTQSLNFIAGLLLLFLPEEKVFWMLHIITSAYLPGTHEVSLEGANIDLWILMVLLRESMPAIYGKIANIDSSTSKSKSPALTVNSRLPDITLGMTNWLMSIFIGTLPIETVLRAWDVFFYEGSKTFFRVSLAIFKASERDIMAVSDPMEVFQVVQAAPKRLLDANALMEDCFIRRNRVGQGRIDELRESRRVAVRKEKARRSVAVKKGKLGAATDEWPRSGTPTPGVERNISDSWRQMRQHAFR